MFVIMQRFNNIESREDSESMTLPEKMALTMKQAGVAITLTSATDIVALLSAALTILPGLYYFCMTAALAITCVFLMQTTWFVAWLTVDQYRIEAQRDGCFPCLVRNGWSKEKARASRKWTKTFMGFVSTAICHSTTKVGRNI